RRVGGVRGRTRGEGSAQGAGGGQRARRRAAAGGEDACLLRGDQTQRFGRGGSVGGIGLLGEPREVVIRNHPSQRSFRQPVEPICLSLLLLKLRLSSTPHSRKAATTIARRSPLTCLTPEGTWSRSRAGTSPDSLSSIS